VNGFFHRDSSISLGCGRANGDFKEKKSARRTAYIISTFLLPVKSFSARPLGIFRDIRMRFRGKFSQKTKTGGA